MGSELQDRGSVWSRLILLVLGTVAGFFLAECALAFALPAPIVWQTPQERYQNHTTRLFALCPNQRAFTHDKRVTINALGFRGDEVVIPKLKNSYRIVAMGDSITFGNGVGDDETYSAQLARMLHDSGLRGVEVINAGIPAYDTWQEALLLEEVILSLEPNLVVLGFYENDISPRPEVIRPIIGAAGDAPRRGLGAWLGDHWIVFFKKSRALALGWEAYQRGHARWFPSKGEARRAALLRGEHDFSLEAGWKEVFQSLRTMGTH